MRKLLAIAGVAMLAAAAGLLPAGAQDYPNKPIRLIVPYPPGASTDISGRIMAEALGPILGQNVVVENRAGAGGLTGIDFVAKSAPDGYTLGWPSADPVAYAPGTRKTMPYRVPEDLTFIGKFAETGFTFSISSNLPIKTLPELIAYAKANPGKLRYGSTGVAGSAHLATLLFEKHAGVKMVHVPYRGGAPALTDLLGGHLDLLLVTPAAIAPHVTSDKIRIIAITSPERHPQLPNVPSVAELGLKDVVFASWFGIVAPAKLPDAVQDRLRKAMAEAVALPAVKEKAAAAGIQYAPLIGPDFEKLVVREVATIKALADAEKLVVED